mmetsp:Transcript_16283/g.49779  ORF Transcript_16283/g.49779 Transcript_16283/m.49779 type:complete len:427 (+) Transcript_16283:1587-2867(+)
MSHKLLVLFQSALVVLSQSEPASPPSSPAAASADGGGAAVPGVMFSSASFTLWLQAALGSGSSPGGCASARTDRFKPSTPSSASYLRPDDAVSLWRSRPASPEFGKPTSSPSASPKMTGSSRTLSSCPAKRASFSSVSRNLRRFRASLRGFPGPRLAAPSASAAALACACAAAALRLPPLRDFPRYPLAPSAAPIPLRLPPPYSPSRLQSGAYMSGSSWRREPRCTRLWMAFCSRGFARSLSVSVSLSSTMLRSSLEMAICASSAYSTSLAVQSTPCMSGSTAASSMATRSLTSSSCCTRKLQMALASMAETCARAIRASVRVANEPPSSPWSRVLRPSWITNSSSSSRDASSVAVSMATAMRWRLIFLNIAACAVSVMPPPPRAPGARAPSLPTKALLLPRRTRSWFTRLPTPRRTTSTRFASSS